ncbi:hypothetical protein Q8F55_005137 [Vanrija albida]|uniref:Peptidase M64 N-terminal domain-containing protein n=1 Tax=Vanrija albida TaxID=181172 RepID=A0ABR3Q0U7_9TREE
MLARIAALALALGTAAAQQAPFAPAPPALGPHLPRDPAPSLAGDSSTPPPNMTLYPLSVGAGPRVALTFFSDGYTAPQEARFVADARALTAAVLDDGGAFGHVRDLVDVWAVFVPSEHEGLGKDAPLEGAPFGLYRHGPELRGVYPAYPGRARAACDYWRGAGTGGCDQAILLGNDGLYGGLGGEFTVITASAENGAQVLRHELGHSLIPVGEEYDGGEVYSGVNAERAENIQQLKWAAFLDAAPRIEDAKVPLQAYPWHDLDGGAWSAAFTSSGAGYTSALVRLSLSSIPRSAHLLVALNGVALAMHWADGSRDRRWVQVELPFGLAPGSWNVTVALTAEGRAAEAGQGGKMISSFEVIEYAEGFRKGGVGAYPTYDVRGHMTLRPTNEECLMRDVTYPNFCPVCAHGLRAALLKRIEKKKDA